ncbi:MAG TPA: OmpW family outer membrane protein [Oligoflexia bacterium]|nr:OmpW family outer membrane protein [Oligoflexia bacterium]
MKRLGFAAIFIVFLGVTFYGIKDVRGELVFEDELAMEGSTNEVAPAAPVVSEPVAAPRIEERRQITRSEAMRRHRLREELKNEDLLTQKLEELRLKDEMKRTDQIMVSGVEKSNAAESSTLVEQRVGSAATDPALASPATGTTPIAGPGASASSVDGTMVAVDAPKSEDDEALEGRVSIMPRVGLSSITGSMYDVESKFATGITIGVDATDHIGFQAGYTFAKYSIGAGNTLMYPNSFNTGYLQKLNMNDNVIDLGVKGNLLGRKSRVRPFVGAGLAYRKGYVNYDDRTLDYIKRVNPYGASDVEISGFSGYLEAGLEFRITKAISLVGMFRYYNIFTSSQTNPLNPYAFIGSNGYNGGLYYGGLGYNGYGYNQDSKSSAGDALAKNNFYQLSAGVSISF